MSELDSLNEYLDMLDDAEGYLHTATGIGPHFDENGKYSHRHWRERSYRWPAERRNVVGDLLAAAEDSDAYVCPYVAADKRRRKHGAAARSRVHADVDHANLDATEVVRLGGWAVASGTPGHAQVYISLAQSVTSAQHEALCRGLCDRLGGDRAKVNDNDLLRAPGTRNHKARAAGGEASPVAVLIRPSGVTVDPSALAARLGVDLDNCEPATAPTAATAATATAATAPAEPVDLEGYPAVAEALARNTGDRSADTMRVVGACHDAGLTLTQARAVVASRADLAGRLAERNDDDVLRCWLVVTDNRQSQQWAQPAPGGADTESDTPPAVLTLDEARAVFRRWLGQSYDTDALDAMVAAVAVERFDDGSDPLWLLIVGGPGAAKTETVQACDGIGAIVASSISSEAALLSATPKRERSKAATGGLLRRLGDRGVLVIKDVTSILSMNRDLRARVLAALREVYDGRWTRDVGTDGGLEIPWRGRLVLVGAVTTAWDAAHAVISSMGDRFVLVRLDSSTGRQRAGRRAIGNAGSERVMRAELADAVAGVIAGMNLEPITVTDAETDVLIAAADLVTLARTAVEYDYRGDVIDAHAPEMPTRFAKQLTQIVRGAVAVGMNRGEALRLAIRCARDSMPPLRLAIIDDLAARPRSTSADVRKRVDKPRNTVDRQMQALHMLGVLTVDEVKYTAGADERTRWFYSLANGINPGALDPKSVPDLSVDTPSPHRREGEREPERQFSYRGTDISGTPEPPPLRCELCGCELLVAASIERGHCEECSTVTRCAGGVA